MPISVITSEQACKMFYSDRNVRAERFYNQHVKTVNKRFPIPAVLVTNSKKETFETSRKTSKRILFMRDKGQCVYCKCKLKIREATIDHVIPKSKGGDNSWNNLVISCFDCNNKKTNLSLKEIGYEEINAKKPTFVDIYKAPEEWQPYINFYL